MGCGASAPERYAPAGERSDAVQGDRAVEPRAQSEAEQSSLEPQAEPVPVDQDEIPAKPWQEADPEPSALKKNETVEPPKAQQDKPAVGDEMSVEPSVQHWQRAQPGAEEATPKEWQRPATWPAPKEVSPPGPDAPHVVLSTKFEEPWGTISRGLKEILVEKGCTVYNPNTDNKEPGHAANICKRILCFNCFKVNFKTYATDFLL